MEKDPYCVASVQRGISLLSNCHRRIVTVCAALYYGNKSIKSIIHMYLYILSDENKDTFGISIWPREYIARRRRIRIEHGKKLTSWAASLTWLTLNVSFEYNDQTSNHKLVFFANIKYVPMLD